ncbi:hypothetical protein MNBD_GAMMA08-2286 [hydrothermal vent metagenome]|uniref:TIGR02281 family clan AA aspartic protease n=1 Tax=hydrothermal vent metagenome TaxID=652676 RepID=A0A3B0X4S0_9ZZZZ
MKIIKLILLLFALPLQAVETIDVQALMPGLVVLVIDGERATLRTGDNVDGVKLISSNTKSAILEVDGEKKEFKMGTTIGTHFKQRELITERVVSDKNGMFKGYGSINGQSVNYLIDTGATTIAMSAKEARKLGIQYRMEGKPTHANTASGIAKAWSIQLKTVRLGKLLERNVRGMVVDGDFPTQVLLGMSFLNRMKVEKEGKLMLITRKK